MNKKIAQHGVGQVVFREKPRRGGWCECCNKQFVGKKSEVSFCRRISFKMQLHVLWVILLSQGSSEFREGFPLFRAVSVLETSASV